MYGCTRYCVPTRAMQTHKLKASQYNTDSGAAVVAENIGVLAVYSESTLKAYVRKLSAPSRFTLKTTL